MDTNKQHLMYLGEKSDNTDFKIPVDILKRHVSIFGKTGTGKTVVGKTIIEECAMSGIPSILIDTQGDLASLALIEDQKILNEKKILPSYSSKYSDTVEVKIFTPASTSGIPLCMNPFKIPNQPLEEEKIIRVLDATASGIISLLGYNHDSSDGKSAKILFYEILKYSYESKIDLNDFEKFAQLIENFSTEMDSIKNIISEKKIKKITHDLRYLTVGINKLLFQFGKPINIDLFLDPINSEKTPINIIYLNTLMSENLKQFFVTMIGREIYNWMLKNPSDKPQLVFYIDEVSTYIPPDPFYPPAKNILRLLLKQGRKFGISCIMNTQNIADVDYKSVGQASTKMIGAIEKQDIEKIKPYLKTKGELNENIMSSLSTLKSLEFYCISPEIFDTPILFKNRWLLTKHEGIKEEELKDLNKPYIKEYYKTNYSVKEIKERITDVEKNVTDDILPKKSYDEYFVFNLEYPKNKAIRIIKKISRKSIFQNVKIDKISFKYLPLYQCRCEIGPEQDMILRIEKTILDMGLDKLFFKNVNTQLEKFVYVNAIDNKILVLKNGFLTFSHVISDTLFWMKGIEENASIISIKKDSIINDFIEPVVNENDVKTTVYRTFGVNPDKATLIFLPIWLFEIEIEDYKMFKKLDGSMGLEII